MYTTDFVQMIQELSRDIQTMPGTIQRVKSLNVKISRNGDVRASVSTESHIFLKANAAYGNEYHERQR